MHLGPGVARLSELSDIHQLHLVGLQRLRVGLACSGSSPGFSILNLVMAGRPGRPSYSLAAFNSSFRKLVVRLAWLRWTVTFCSMNLVTSSRTTACAL